MNILKSSKTVNMFVIYKTTHKLKYVIVINIWFVANITQIYDRHDVDDIIVAQECGSP